MRAVGYVGTPGPCSARTAVAGSQQMPGTIIYIACPASEAGQTLVSFGRFAAPYSQQKTAHVDHSRATAVAKSAL